jgi:hypothetical protein
MQDARQGLNGRGVAKGLHLGMGLGLVHMLALRGCGWLCGLLGPCRWRQNKQQ